MKISTPHDRLFKKFFGDIALARNFFEIHLPSSILKIVSFPSLKMVPGSFIDKSLKQSHSDMVYSFETSTGKEGYLYCVVEHQSTDDKMMAFRMKKYSSAVMQQHLDQGHDTLPLVLPVLFYHGQKSPYPHSMDWRDCFCEKELARILDSQPFPLVDVTMLPEEEIMKHGIISWLEMSQKMVHTRDMMEIAPYLIRLDKLFPLNDELFKSLLYYLFQEGETADRMLFFDALSSTTQRENVMTIAEELKREGREEGREEIAKNLLNNGFSFKQVKMYTGLSEDSLNKLLH